MMRLMPLCWMLWTSVAIAAGEAEPAAAEQQNLFSGSWGDALWTVVAFLVLLIVLSRVAWRPLQETLQARQKHIEDQLKAAEQSRKRAEQLLDDYKQQGLALVKEAQEQSRRQQQHDVDKTQTEIVDMKRRALEDIENARSAAMEQLWRQTEDVVLQLGTHVLGRSVTEQDTRRLMDEAVARIRQGGGQTDA